MRIDGPDLADQTALFRTTGDPHGPHHETLIPLPNSASGWGSDQIRGMAVSGALARATERTADEELPEMRPVRWHVDLFRAARVRPTEVRTSVIRRGGRIGLIDAELWQEDRPVARSRTLFARPGESPPGTVWQPGPQSLLTPPAGLRPTGDEARLYYSEQLGWTAAAEPHQNSDHKRLWHFPVTLVQGQPVTAFQMVASVADMANLVVNWGAGGVEFINADIDLVLTRPPAAMEVGLSVVDRAERDGVAHGTAVVYDRQGVIGRVSVVAVANPVRRVDPGDRRPDLALFDT